MIKFNALYEEKGDKIKISKMCSVTKEEHILEIDKTASNPYEEGFRCKRKFLAYTLEDEYREEKVYGETRIPNGTYELGLRKVGG